MSQKLNFEKLIAQAKDSVKVLETLQKEGLARVLAAIPSKEEAQKITNDKIVSALKRMGFATQDDLHNLEQKIEELATELRSQITKSKKQTSKGRADVVESDSNL
jgi:hypothetical protein